MTRMASVAAVIAAAGVASPLLAQDSVSRNVVPGALPGDALDTHDASTEVTAYNVTLTPFQTSRGTTFGVAPVVKLPRVSTENFLTNLPSGNYLSRDLAQGVPYASPSYLSWTQPGQGIHPQNNLLAGAVTPAGASSRFGLGVSSFGGNANVLTAAMVNYDPAQPTELYVTRYRAAVNGSTPAQDAASFGFGSIDADGNVFFRADANATTGPNALTGQNLFRVRLADFSDDGVLNVISNLPASWDAAAVDRMLTNSSTTTTTPSSIPASIAGGNGVIVGPNYNNQYYYGASGTVTLAAARAHLYASVDHRGLIDGIPGALLGGDGDYTLATYAKDMAGDTNVMNLFEVHADGSLAGAKTGLFLPPTVSDPIDAFTRDIVGGGYDYQFTNYYGVTPFNGSPGGVALGRDRDGRVLVAATYGAFGLSNDFENDIVVHRYDPADPQGTLETVLGAWVFVDAGTGKEIVDANDQPVGWLIDSVTAGRGLRTTMSAPSFDGAGNLWFVSTVGLDFDGDGDIEDYDTALIRGIYQPDVNGTFGYKLELVFDLGKTFDGADSGTPWRITFLNVSIGNGNASPASVWSGSSAPRAFENIDLSAHPELGNEDPRTLGGVIVTADIVYDRDGDGDFDDPTSSNGDPSSADESYSVLLYVGNTTPFDDVEPCPGDWDGNETVNVQDLIAFLQAFGAGDADFDGNGSTNVQDLIGFLQAFAAGC